MATRKKIMTSEGATHLTNECIPIVDANGDLTQSGSLTFNSTYGLIKREPYGSMYLDDGSVRVVISAINTEYQVTGGLYAGSCNGFDFGGDYRLTATIGGKYKVDWGMTIDCNKNNQIVEGGVMVNGVGQVQTTGSTELVSGNGAPAHVSGTGIIDVPANSEITFYVENDTATNYLIVTHANMTLIRVDDLPS